MSTTVIMEGQKPKSIADSLVVLPRMEGETGSAYAYRVLEYNILMLHMAPGAWIRERLIADKLAVSRTPVHEAIGLLRDRRLVDVAPQSATHVSLIDIDTLRQGIFLRSVVEPIVVSQLVGNVSGELLQKLEANIRVQKQLVESSADVYLYTQVTSEFWELLYVAAHKGYLWELLYQATVPLERLRYILLLNKLIEPNTQYCQQLYTYLHLGINDTIGINQAIQAEINSSVQKLDTVMEQFPQYFSNN